MTFTREGILKVVKDINPADINRLRIELGDMESRFALAFLLFNQEFPEDNTFNNLISALNTYYNYQIEFSICRFKCKDNIEIDVNCLVLTANNSCNTDDLIKYLVTNYFSFVQEIKYGSNKCLQNLKR
jgi:hypothetical protein